MVAIFLLAELDSPKYAEGLKRALSTHDATVELVRYADTNDQDANRLRREILTTHRGWGQMQSLFGGLPKEDVEWVWMELDEEDLRTRVFKIDYYFQESLGTRSLNEIGAMKRREDPESVRPILESVRVGQMPEPPILLADTSLERLVILEGHNRMIAYATEPKEVPFPIRAILGMSARISEWSEW